MVSLAFVDSQSPSIIFIRDNPLAANTAANNYSPVTKQAGGGSGGRGNGRGGGGGGRGGGGGGV